MVAGECSRTDGGPDSATNWYATRSTVRSPTLCPTSRVSLEQTLVERRSDREFAPAELTLDIIHQLFWAGQGIVDDQGHRTRVRSSHWSCTR